MKFTRPLTCTAWLGLSLGVAVVGYQIFGVGRPVEETPPTRPVSAVTTPSTGPDDPPPVTPLTSSTVEPTAPAVQPGDPAQPVAPELPAPERVERVEISVAGYASEAGSMEIADSGVIDPPDFNHVWWVRDRGVAPARGATDTAYLACHAHSGRSAADVPCNRIAPETVPIGSPLSVTTDVETLTYEVTSVRLVSKDELASEQEAWGVHPGRLVWVTHYLEDGRLSDFNTVVIAELSA